MTSTIDIAQALIGAHRARGRIDARRFPSLDYRAALDIQQQVQASLGPVGGFKVARRPEGPPVIAPIDAGHVLPSGSDVPVIDSLGVELEIGFQLVGEAPGRLDDNSRHTFVPRLVLELVDTRLEGEGHDPMLKLADNQINAGLIVGPAFEAWDGRDFGSVQAALRCGTQQVIAGEATVPGGSALANLSLFLEHVGQHCGGLQSGQVVITGSLSGLPYFPSGTDVFGSVEGFGEVSCHLV